MDSCFPSSRGTQGPFEAGSTEASLKGKDCSKDQAMIITDIVEVNPTSVDLSSGTSMPVIEQQFLKHTGTDSLLKMSEKLRAEIRSCCETGTQTILPSFVDRFAESLVSGVYLSLEVGGSTLRVALIQLQESGAAGRPDPKILSSCSWPMSSSLKNTSGTAFFRWIAQQAVGMLKRDCIGESEIQSKGEEALLPISLTWSFPFEQTAIDKGVILKSGKGFSVFDSLIGAEISTLIVNAFRNENILTRVVAIVHDVVAGLLAANYVNPLTQCSVVLGTGLNAAISMSPSHLAPQKLARTKAQPLHNTEYLLVNTELSLLGQEIFPRTQWDEKLVAQLPPDVCHQPLEYLCSGYYLGEIVRLILVEAVDQDTSFSRCAQACFERPFSFESSLVAVFEEDTTPGLMIASEALSGRLRLSPEYQPTLSDLRRIQNVARCVSRRAAAYMAVCIHALCQYAWDPKSDKQLQKGSRTMERRSVNVSGAVFEKYPHFMETCEGFLVEMLRLVSADPVCYTLQTVPNCSMIGTVIAAAALRSTSGLD